MHEHAGERIGEASNPGPVRTRAVSALTSAVDYDSDASTVWQGQEPAASPRATTAHSDGEFIVTAIIGSRRKDHHTEYLVQWAGSDSDGTPHTPSWEPESNLRNCDTSIDAFHKRDIAAHPDAPAFFGAAALRRINTKQPESDQLHNPPDPATPQRRKTAQRRHQSNTNNTRRRTAKNHSRKSLQPTNLTTTANGSNRLSPSPARAVLSPIDNIVPNGPPLNLNDGISEAQSLADQNAGEPPIVEVFDAYDMSLRDHSLYPPLFTPFTTMPDFDNVMTEVLPVLLNLHVHAQRLCGRSPSKRFKATTKATWKQVMDSFAPTLKGMLDTYEQSQDPLDLLNATLAYLELPGRYLVRILGKTPAHGPHNIVFEGIDAAPASFNAGVQAAPHDGPPPPHPFVNLPKDLPDADRSELSKFDTDAIRHAAKLAEMGRPNASRKALIGHGVAPRTRDTANDLYKLQIKLQEQILLPPINNDAANTVASHVTAEVIYEINKRKAGINETPQGFFGWADDLYRTTRGRRLDAPCNLMAERSRLQAILARPHLKDVIAFTLITASITALNKVSAANQDALKANGKPSSLRPVQSGANLPKATFNAAIRSPTGKALESRLKVLNVGMGEKSGCEIMATRARASAASNKIVCTNDVVNAYGTFKRQSLFNALPEEWPEGAHLFHNYYSIRGVSIFSYKDENGIPTLFVTPSEEGSRQGCVLGTYAFCIPMHKVYKQLDEEFRPRGVSLQAVIDDVVPAFTVLDHNNIVTTYDLIAEWHTRYDALANPHNIKRHPDKGKMFLQPHHPPPPQDHPILTLTKVSREGLTVVGAHIGTDSDVTAAAVNKAHKLMPRLDAIVKLAAYNAQAATGLIMNSACNALSYLAKVTPPSLLNEAAVIYDNLVIDCRNKTLQRPNTHITPPTPQFRITFGNKLAALPIRFGGMAHESTAFISTPAYISSIATACRHHSMADPTLKATLLPHITSAYVALAASIHAPTTCPRSHPAIQSLLPESPALLINPVTVNLLSPSNQTTPTQKKLQAKLTQVMHITARQDLRDYARALNPRPNPPPPHNPFAGFEHLATHMLYNTSRSQNSRVFAADSGSKYNRVPSERFVPSCRWYLGMPQLVHYAASTGATIGRTDDSKDWAICSTCPHVTLDPGGMHCASCAASYKPRYVMHTGHCRVWYDFSLKAGAHAELEPHTAGVLREQFNRRLLTCAFPKRSNAASKALSAQVRLLMTAAAKPNADQADTLALNMLLAQCSDDSKGLRLDLAIALHNGQELWLDHGNTHATQACMLKRTSKFMCDLYDAEVSHGGRIGAKHKLFQQASPAINNMVKSKTLRYAPLVKLAQAQIPTLRQTSPIFLPTAMSHEGEFSSQLIQAVELLTKSFRSNLITNGSLFPDGVSVSRRTAEFRTSLKDALICTSFSGTGSILLSSGRSILGMSTEEFANSSAGWDAL